MALLESFSPEVQSQSIDDFIEIPRHHAFEPIQREADPMIGNPILGEVVCAYAFRAVASTHLSFPFGADG